MAKTFEACGVYLLSKGKLLLLKRASHKRFGGKWCVPGGGLEEGETPLDAALRELYGETGIILNKENLTHKSSNSFLIEGSDDSCLFHQFAVLDDSSFQVALNGEHDEYSWVDLKDVFAMDLVQEEDTCIKRCFDL